MLYFAYQIVRKSYALHRESLCEQPRSNSGQNRMAKDNWLLLGRCHAQVVAREVQESMTDRSLTCRDCGQQFTFTAGEQEFYTQRGFSEPQRCPDCRAARKTQRGGAGASGGGYSSGGGSDYSGGGSGYSSGGGYDDGAPRAPRQLYAATCSECGQATEVPFQPTPGKPVYCRDCFQNRKAAPRYNSSW